MRELEGRRQSSGLLAVELEPDGRSQVTHRLESHPSIPVIPAGLEALTIRTSVDLTVVPHESAMLPDVPDLVICCPTHRGLLRDEQAFQRVLRFLAGS